MLQKWIEKTWEKIVYVLFSGIVIYLFVMGCINTGVMAYTDQHIFFVKDPTSLLIFGLALLGMLGIHFRKCCKMIVHFMQKKQVKLFLTILWVALMLAWIFTTLMPPFHDQRFVVEASASLLKGDFASWEKGGYMYMYPFQAGLALLYTPFHLLFGSKAILCIELFNMGCFYSTAVLIEKMSEACFGEAVAIFSYFGLLFYFPVWGYVIFAYGTIPGLLFAVLGFYLIFMYINGKQAKQVKWLLFAALSFAISTMWKNNYIIFAIAACLILFFYLIRERDWKALIGICTILILWKVSTSGILLFMHVLTGQDTGNGIPYIGWMAMGLRDSSIAPGWYNRFTEMTYEACGYDGKAVVPIAWQELKDNLQLFLQQPDYAARFFARKINSMWNSPLMEGTVIVAEKNCNGTLPYFVKDIVYNGGILHTLLFIVFDIVQIIVYAGTVLFVVLEKWDYKKAFGIITFLGGFTFHILWEAKCQYAIPYYLLLLPYAFAGWKAITTAYKKRIKTMIAITGLTLILAYVPLGPISSYSKLGTDTTDYIYYCQNETQWKDSDYFWHM